MKKKWHTGGVCPVCDSPYGKHHTKTRHHIFPKWWYKDGLTIYVCSQCHQKEFHTKYRMKFGEVWSISECVKNWVDFCKSKGKNAYIIYPELRTLKPML